MTYIVTGRLKNKAFMMTDCIMTNSQNGDRTFIHKLHKLKSAENTYYSFTGIQFIDICVRAYDYWLSNTNRKNDFCTGNSSVAELSKVIKRMILHFNRYPVELGEARFFFISPETAVAYDLVYDNSNTLIRSDRTEIPEGFQMTSAIETGLIQIELHTADIKQYCKDTFTLMTRGTINLRDRFSFALINGENVTFEEPFKHFSDIIAMYNEINFDVLDEDSFVWNI